MANRNSVGRPVSVNCDCIKYSSKCKGCRAKYQREYRHRKEQVLVKLEKIKEIAPDWIPVVK